jgi:DNA polymerase-3 subunit gamma/tau
LAELMLQYEAGADPLVVLQDLLSLTHWVTRLKLVPEAAQDATASQSEIERGRALAPALELNVLTRAFAILLKGIAEVQAAPDSLAACEMVLVKLGFAAGLPTPDEALRALKSGPALPTVGISMNAGPSGSGPAAQALRAQPQAQPQSQPKPAEPVLSRFEDVVARAQAERDVLLMSHLETYVHLVRFEPGLIEFRPAAGAPGDLAGRLNERLAKWTGRRWAIGVVQADGQATLAEQRRKHEAALKEEAAQHPIVAAVLAAFPGASITAIRDLAAQAGEAPQDFVSDPDDDEELP